MAVSTAQYDQILARLTTIEESMNDIITALGNFVTLAQVMQVLSVLQTEVDDLRTTVDALSARTEVLENEPLS